MQTRVAHELYHSSLFKYSPDIVISHQKNADSIINLSKIIDKNNYQVHKPLKESDLLDAMKLKQFTLYYQPKVYAKTNQIIGAEALIRWNHPDLGIITPDKFIPLAESTGVINELGKWVTNTTCNQIKAWQESKLPNIPVSINLSATHFLEKDLITSIIEILKETSLDAKYLEIEITETSLLENEEIVFSTLDKLRDLGIKIALDDFGTGYSSLSYLKRFKGRIDTLKIDRSFIQDLSSLHQEDSNFIVNMIIQLSHQLKMDVIAEGVETKEQLIMLQHYNCNTVQGYLFSKPIPADEFAKLLKNGTLKPLENNM